MYKFVIPNFYDLRPFSYKMDPDFKIILGDSDVRVRPVSTNWETQDGGFNRCPLRLEFNLSKNCQIQ